MRKIYLLLFGMLSVFVGFSQVSVTATVGTVGPTAYTNLKAAFDAINGGTHKGVIAIAISGSTTETSTMILNASGNGSASYTAISIKPTGGASRTVSGDFPGALIDFDGTDNLTIDGLNSGGNALTISNINTTAGASTIRFINDASNNTVQNATVLGAGSSLTFGTIFFSTGTATGNDNNTINNCNITDAATGTFPVNAIYSSGTATTGQENSGNIISNNNISNFFNPDFVTVGLLVGPGNTDWTISNNKFFQTASRTYTTAAIHRAIQITAGNNYTIIGNIIGYASSSATGTYTMAGTVATRFIAIDLAVGGTVASSVQNNTITSFSLTTSSNASGAAASLGGIWSAINITSGDVNVGTVTGNTIGSTTATGAITLIPTVASSGAIPISSATTGTVNISNNTIGGIDFVPTGVLSGNIQSIQVSANTVSATVKDNIIGNSLPNNIKIGALGITTGNGLIRGIFIGTTNTGTILVTGNTIRNLTHNSSSSTALFRAIECQTGTATISNNVISNVTAAGASTSITTTEGIGILATTTATGLTIDGNTLSNLSVTNSTTLSGPVILGIYLNSGVNDAKVTRNKIYGFSNLGNATSLTVPSLIAGIYIRDAGTASPNILVANNMISFGNAQATNSAIIGIWNATASTSGLVTKIYYNTVNIEGTVTTGAQPSFCYYRGDFSATGLATPTVDLKNNIFTNARSGGTGKHYAIANGYPSAASNTGGWIANSSDYNILNANSATVGYWSADVTFDGWQFASSSDAHSYTTAPITYVNSASDLHLVTTANTAVDGKATPIAGTTIDIDNTARNATTPDIGADEFIYTGPSVPIIMEYFNGRKLNSSNALNWKSGCTSTSVRFDIERSTDGRKFASIGNFSATQTRCAQPFDYADNNPLAGTNYYRLKMTEADGRVYYSAIIAIINKETGFEIVGMMPTLVTGGTAVLNVTAAQNSKLEITITDMNGRIMLKQNKSTIIAGSNMLTIDLGKLAAGTYQLTGFTTEGNTGTVRFVKQ